MTQLRAEGSDQPLRLWIKAGQSIDLPGGRGSITFDGVERWAGLSVRTDRARA